MLNSYSNLGLSEKENLIQPLLQGISENKTESIKEFFEIFSDDIYNFPIRYNNFSEDEAADFYLYAFEHLKNGKKISSFQGKSKFTTWFFSVLRNLVIDFLRTRRNKLKIASMANITPDGVEFDFFQNIPDHTQNNNDFEQELTHQFLEYIEKLNINQRILLKLAYIHYLDFENLEIEWLSKLNETSIEKILKEISRLKNIALLRANEIKNIEDRLTMNFLAIDNLELKLNSFFQEHPELPRNEKEWSEIFTSPEIPEDINKIIQSLSRKKERHLHLIQTQQKSLLATRIPYKEFSGLLKSSDGVLSVQLSRLLKKINNEM
jgi:RNA polymerase sigma factor (sigma-70 family)